MANNQQQVTTSAQLSPAKPKPPSNTETSALTLTARLQSTSKQESSSGEQVSPDLTVQSQRTVNPNPPCTCPSTVNATSDAVKSSQCPVCLSKFDTVKVPIGLKCGHSLCLSCVKLLVPGSFKGESSDPVCTGLQALDLTVGLPNLALLAYLDHPVGQFLGSSANIKFESDCLKALQKLVELGSLLRNHGVSRAIHRKMMNLLTSFNPKGQARMLRCSKGIGERTLVELTSSCGSLSHYQAQQQLWAAIRARACQFMGPAMQEEALKLVLLALEDGSALSRKVLVMFVVQRLAPQFPQASKTSVGHIIQLLYRASTFDVIKRPGNSSLMTLRPEYRTYESLRREHDAQIMKIGLDAGIRFTPEQWSSLLYGDTSHKPLMQSILDKLQTPQTFADLLKEFLVCIQRLNEADAQAFLAIYPHFQSLSAIDVPQQGPVSTTTGAVGGKNEHNWSQVEAALNSVHIVLTGLLSFEKPSVRRKYQAEQVNRHHQYQQQQYHQANRSSNHRVQVQVPNHLT